MINLNPRYAVIAACIIGLAGCRLESSSTITKIDTTINTDVLVPVTLKHTGDNTAITNIRVSNTAPTLVSQQASTCPATLSQNQSCVVTLKLNTTLANQGKFDVLVKYRNTRGEQTVEPNLTINYNVANPAQQTFIRFGSQGYAIYYGIVATGFFDDMALVSYIDDSTGSVRDRNKRQLVDPLTGETVREIGPGCRGVNEVDKNGNCIYVTYPDEAENGIRKVYKVNGDGDVLFEYDYSFETGYPNISLFADGTAVFADFKSIEHPYNEPVKYYFFNSSGQRVFEKVGPAEEYLDFSWAYNRNVKQIKDSGGNVYYTISTSKAFDTYDGQGNKVCSGSPAFEAPVGRVSAVQSSPMASDRPTNEIYYVNSFPLAFESNGVDQKPFTSRTILAYDMLNCQQTKSKTITPPPTGSYHIYNPNFITQFYERNGRIEGLKFDNGLNTRNTLYFDATTQTMVDISGLKKLEMMGPVLRNGSIYTEGEEFVTIEPWHSEGYYYFYINIKNRTGGAFPPTDVFNIMGHNVSPSSLFSSDGSGYVRVWGIARLNANGKLEVSKAINAAN